MKKEDLKQKREHDARKRYHKSCRKMIHYQIEEYKANNLWSYGKHLDHDPYTFGMIVDVFREMLQIWQRVDRLPTIIIDYTIPGAMFRKYHETVAVYKVVEAKDNLSKASKQTRKNNYGMTDDEFTNAIEFLKKCFIDMFGEYHDE